MHKETDLEGQFVEYGLIKKLERRCKDIHKKSELSTVSMETKGGMNIVCLKYNMLVIFGYMTSFSHVTGH